MAHQKKDTVSSFERDLAIAEGMFQVNSSAPSAPLAYITPLTCNAAWTAWYGSSSQMSAIYNEIINSGIRLERLTRSDLKKMENGELIGIVLLEDRHRSVLQEQIGRERVLEISPQSTLASKTAEIIGTDLYDKLQSQIKSLPSFALLEMTRDAFPQLGEIMEVGGFSHEVVTAGLMLRPILDNYLNIGLKSNDEAIDFCMDMVVHLYLQMIPVDDIRKCILNDFPRFKSMYLPTDASKPIVDQISPIFGGDKERIALSAHDVLKLTVERRLTNHGKLDALLETIQGLSMATSSASRLTRVTVQSVADEANIGWRKLCDSLKLINTDPKLLQTAKIDVESTLLPQELITQANLDLSVVDAAREFHSIICPLFSNKSHWGQASSVHDAIVKLNAEIAEIASNGKIDFERLSVMSSKGADLSSQKDKLVTELLNTASTALTISNAFVGVLETTASSPAFIPTQTPSLSITGIISTESIKSTPRNDIEEELLNLNTKLEADLAAAQSEIFRLSSSNSTLQSRLESPAGKVDRDFADLTRKHVQGHSLTPEELLRFFGLMAADRVVVLDSAWKSSRESDKFAYPERLTEHLSKLIFEYLDQVRAGTPMGQAGRDVFAGAFAARESQSVSQDHSLRAQREFIYNGETRYFEYRLRTGNGWGAVEGLRLYFDVIDGKVVIAYLGPHLDQPSTN